MKKYNPENERIKRSCFTFLKEAKRHSEPTIDAAAKALHRFESYTGHRDFKAFHFQQAVAFKKHLAGQQAEKSGKPLIEQGHAAQHHGAAQTLLSVAGLAAGLQITSSVC